MLRLSPSKTRLRLLLSISVVLNKLFIHISTQWGGGEGRLFVDLGADQSGSARGEYRRIRCGRSAKAGPS